MAKLLNGIQQVLKSTYSGATKDNGTLYFVRDTANGTAEIYIGTKLYASMSNVSAEAVKTLADSIANACGLVHPTGSTDTYISGLPKNTTNYLTAETTSTLVEALVVLDNAIKGNANNITANKITAADKSVTITTATSGSTIGVNVSNISGNALKLDTGATNPGLYVDGNALAKYEGTNAITVGTADTANTRTIALKIDASDKVLTQGSNGLLTNIVLQKSTTTTSGYAATYSLVGNGNTQLGDVINIPKDQFLKSATFIPSATSSDHDADASVIVGDPYLKFVFATNSQGTETDVTSYIAVKDLVDLYYAGNGLSLDKVDSKNTFSIKLDGSNENGFLTVSANGLKLTGISAITTSVATNTTDIAGLKTVSASTQGEIDKIELSAGLNTDGTYTAPTGTAYLTFATGLMDADKKLDSALSSEVTRATAAEKAAKTEITSTGATITVTSTSGTNHQNIYNVEVDGTKVTAAKVANNLTITKSDGTTVNYDGSAAKAVTLNESIVAAMPSSETISTTETGSIIVHSTKTNNITNYTVGLMITGDDCDV